MPCPRCHGLMVAETFYDLACSRPADYRFEGWRCVSCGNVWDRVIAANRSRPRPPGGRSKPGGRKRVRPLRRTTWEAKCGGTVS